MGIGTAIAGAAVIGAGASIISGDKQASATRRAARSAASSSKKAVDAQWDIYMQNREDFMPWRMAGEYGLESLVGKPQYGMDKPDIRSFQEQNKYGVWKFKKKGEDLYNQAMEDYENSFTGYSGGMIQEGPGKFVPEDQPGYKFGYENLVEKPLMAGAAARGKRFSGGTLKDLSTYASGYAETQYDKFLSRYYSSLSPFQSLAGMGQTAAAGTAQAGMNAASGIGNINMASGAAQAGYQQQLGNIQSGQIAGVAGALQGGIGNYMDYQIGKKLGLFGSNNISTAGAAGGADYSTTYGSNTNFVNTGIPNPVTSIGYGNQGAYPIY